MSDPTRPADKAALLAMIQAGYEQLEVLLATLSPEQMTIPGVNGSWSVKDNLAHLAAWQGYQAASGLHPIHRTNGSSQLSNIWHLSGFKLSRGQIA